MAPLVTNLAPTTELEAVNSMLSAIGEAPVTDETAASSALQDVAMAVNLLRNATREVQSVPWRFNFEAGVELAPKTTMVWQDSSGAGTILNIFEVPTGVTSWRLTKCRENGDLDLVQRPSKQYQENGVNVLILYDRNYNRDGADAVTYPLIYIDALYAFNFEQMPETARRLAAVTAGRRFTQQIVGSAELAGFAQGDEALARRLLSRDQGDEEELNMLNTYDAWSVLGQRPRVYGGFMQVVRPGPNPVPVPIRTSDLSDIRVIDT